MDALIFTLSTLYLLGVTFTVVNFVWEWDNSKPYAPAEETRHYARQVILAPLWPRYAWHWIKKIPQAIKNFFSKASQLIKDAR